MFRLVNEQSVLFDLKDCLFQGLILREKDFREFIKTHNWSAYKDMNVAVHCSADAIIPDWAYMLVVSKLAPFAARIVCGSLRELNGVLIKEGIAQLDGEQFRDKKVMIKGCGKEDVPVSSYAEITLKLLPFAHSVMYGEPCSTVPVFKKDS